MCPLIATILIVLGALALAGLVVYASNQAQTTNQLIVKGLQEPTWNIRGPITEAESFYRPVTRPIPGKNGPR